MALEWFDVSSLSELDGGVVAEAMRQAFAAAARDCEDRPAESKVRKVNLQCDMRPIVDEVGNCRSVKAAFQIKLTIPTRKSRQYEFGVKNEGKLFFSTESPGAIEQTTIFEDDSEDRREGVRG